MSIKTIITSAAVSAIAAGSLVPMSSAASARDWNGHRGHGGGPRVEQFDRNGGEHVNRWGEARRDYNYSQYEAPRRHRDHTGRNVAIGVFAAILGLAIASEASRANDYDYRD